MTAHAAAIEALAERVREFLRDDRRRMLHVVAATELRRGAVATVMAAEHAADNFSAFVGFEHPHGADSPGWAARSAAAREQHAARRDHAGAQVPELPPPPPGDDARVGFAQQLWQLLECRPPNTEGLVVVLAPTAVEAPKQWAEGVGLLVGGRRLKDARWIVIDVEGSTVSPVVAGLGARAIQHDMRLPDGAAGARLGELVAGDVGAAPKGIEPPARPDVPSGPLPPESQRRLDVGRQALTAALAFGAGDHVGAVGAQRKARDLCAEAGWTAEALQMEIVLGSQLLAAGQGKAAEETLGRAIVGARKAELADKVTTAGFALGATRMARGEKHTALVAYAEAAGAAEAAGSPMLAIEANRLAGQAAADLKMEPQAITFFSRAVKIAETSPPVQLSSSTAAHAALGLARICRKRGLRPRAVELEAQAERFATPPAPVPEPPPPEPPAVEATPPPLEPRVPSQAPAARPAVSEGTEFLDPAEFLGPLPVPPEQIRNLPEGSALLRRDALMAEYLPPPEGTVLLDDLHPADAPTPPPPIAGGIAGGVVGGTIMLDDLPAAASPAGSGMPADEGTGLLTLEEIAELHWGGVAPEATPASATDGARSWTSGEIEILQHAVNEALEPEATLMLTHDELAALRGEKVDRPAPAPAPAPAPSPPPPLDGLEPMSAAADPPAAASDAVDGLEPIPGLEPAPASARPAAPAAAGKTLDGDEQTSLTLADIRKIRDAMKAAKAAKRAENRARDRDRDRDREGGD